MTLKERIAGLKEKILELAKVNPKYVFGRIHKLLQGVSLKAVHRIWRNERLAIRHKKRRKLLVSKTEGPMLTGPNQAWRLDFCHETLENGRHARIHAAVGCFTRECLLLKAASNFPAFGGERTGLALPRSWKTSSDRFR